MVLPSGYARNHNRTRVFDCSAYISIIRKGVMLRYEI